MTRENNKQKAIESEKKNTQLLHTASIKEDVKLSNLFPIPTEP